jgi:hypothetical protein
LETELTEQESQYLKTETLINDKTEMLLKTDQETYLMMKMFKWWIHHQLYQQLQHHKQSSNHNLSLQILIWKKQKDSGDPKRIILFRQFVHSNNRNNNNSKTDPSTKTTTDPIRANKDFQITNLHNPQGDISKVKMGTLLSHLEGHKLHMKPAPGAHQLAASLLQEVNLGKPDFKNQITPPSSKWLFLRFFFVTTKRSNF